MQVDDLIIFGYIFTLEENLMAEARALGVNTPIESDIISWIATVDVDEETREELRYQHSHELASFENGYRYGRWYSIVEPQGEFGSNHVSIMTRISEEDFIHYEGQGWKVLNFLDYASLWRSE